MGQRDIKTILLSEDEPNQVSAGASGYAWTAGTEATIFYDEDSQSYGYCFHGVADGLYFEGDDFTGFASVEEAEADARDEYKRSLEEEDY